MLEWLDAIFSGYRWYRKTRGGHWESWFIDHPVFNDVWLRNEHGKRPGLARGTPTCEDWP